jgi:hypothetical protein
MSEPSRNSPPAARVARTVAEYLLLVCAITILLGRWEEHGRAALQFARQWLEWIGL